MWTVLCHNMLYFHLCTLPLSNGRQGMPGQSMGGDIDTTLPHLQCRKYEWDGGEGMSPIYFQENSWMC